MDSGKRRVFFSSAVFLLIAATGNDCNNSIDEVKYTVAGPGRANIVYYNTSEDIVEQEGKKLPWSWKDSLPQKSVQLGVGATGRGKLVCRILINNSEVRRNSRVGECKVSYKYKPTLRASPQ